MKTLTSYLYTFEDFIKGNFLYVDKTEYLWKMIKPVKDGYFLSRPRRFGKSLTVSTLKAIFEGKKELFKGLSLYDKPYDWKAYPVIHLDLNGWNFSDLEELKRCLRGVVRESAEDHNVRLSLKEPDEMFRELIRALAKKGKVVILLDEYDKPILNNLGCPHAQSMLNYLKSFYSVIKAFERDLRFVLVTGVSKFAHVSLFSDLNNLTDITMDARYATMLGYTQEELDTVFGDRIRAIAEKQNISIEFMKAKIKDWYDGFRFEETSQNVYNPVSIAKFFENRGKFQNFWFSTGTPSFLLELAKKTNYDFEKVLSQPVSGFAFDAFEISRINPLALLLQTGYLTIGGVEEKYNQPFYHLRFPNLEVKVSFETYLLSYYTDLPTDNVSESVFCLADYVKAGDVDGFMETMKVFFAKVNYGLHQKDENNFQMIFFAIFMLLGINIKAESQTNQGRIDAVAENENFVFIFEFKLNRTAEIALEQIKDRDYFRRYLLSGKRIVLVGANFDDTLGQLTDWKTEEVKA